MDLIDIAAVTFVAAAIAGVVNHRWMRLPPTVVMVLFSLGACLTTMLLDRCLVGLSLTVPIAQVVATLNFPTILLNGLLGFMLFAGALHVDMQELARRKFPVALMASVGVLVSTVIVAILCKAGWSLLGVEVPMPVCLVFGALISPTDPVAVLSAMKSAHMPKALEAKIAGESLFNDGVAIVVFLAALSTAAPYLGQAAHVAPSATDIILFFIRNAFGGAALGVVLGWGACRLMSMVDEHSIEIMVTIGLVTAVMALSRALGVSGPIAVVTAGLIMGTVGKRKVMSPKTRHHLESFWSVLEECCNAVLFLLLGMEVLVITPRVEDILAALIAIPAVLLARFLSVGVSMAASGIIDKRYEESSFLILTWGGLRGAVSLALALMIPAGQDKPLLLTVTYIVVIFSVVVQGLSVGKLVKYTLRRGT